MLHVKPEKNCSGIMKTLAIVLLVAGTALATSFDGADPQDDIQRGSSKAEYMSRSKRGAKKTSPPHLIYILLDDLGFNHISWNNADVITPHLQALADRGVILDNNYAQAVCSPSRGALMFGQYPLNTGMQHDVISYQAPECADLYRQMLPEKLKPHGYDTYMVGKWHLGFCNYECTPLRRGFDKFYGFYHSHIDYYTHMAGYTGHTGYDLRDGPDVDAANNGTYTTDLLTEQAIEMIRDHDSDTPMFMYLSHAAPHTPLQADQRFLDLYPEETNAYRKTLKAMVSAADDSIGRVVRALKTKGMYANSVIMFSSDNGGQAFLGDNYPLRGTKSSIFEGGTRVPGMFHSPLATVTGIRTKGLFHITDWHTTMLALAGADTSGLDGVDQTGMLFLGRESARNEIVYNIDNEFPQVNGAYGIRVGDYKLIRGYGGQYDGWEQYGGVDYTILLDVLNLASSYQRYESPDPNLVHAYIASNADVYQLFNLADDPEERNNLARARPDKVAELEARINELAAVAQEINLAVQMDVPEASPNNFNGIWESGWC